MTAAQYFTGAQFSTDVARGRVENGKWILSGKLFEPGEYPDKKFSMTLDEMKASAARFKSAKLNDDHNPQSFFTDKLGEVIAVEVKENELHGTAAFPLWMKEAAGDEPIKLSCEWDRQTKDLAAVAVTMNPRVHDAALFAAFSSEMAAAISAPDAENKVSLELDEANFKTTEGRAFFSTVFASFAKKKTYEGQSILQSVHDTTARAGAVCNIKEGVSNFHTSAELNRIQELHDIATKGGASCSKGDGKPSYGYFSITTSDQPDTQRKDDTEMAEQGLDEKGLAAFFKKHFPNVFGAAASDDTKSGEQGKSGGDAAAFNNDPALMARLKTAEEARITTEVSRLVQEGRVPSKMKDRVTADFKRALEDDISAPRLVKFSVTEVGADKKEKSVEKEGTRLDERIAYYSELPKSSLFTETIPADTDLRVLLSDETPEDDMDGVAKQAERIAARHNPKSNSQSGGGFIN